MVTIKKFESPGILSLKAYFDNVDDMLDAKSEFEQNMFEYSNQLDNIIIESSYEQTDNEFILNTRSYYKYMLN